MARLRFVVYAAVIFGAWIAAGHLGVSGPLGRPGGGGRGGGRGGRGGNVRLPAKVSEAVVARARALPFGQGYLVVLSLKDGGVGQTKKKYLTIVVGVPEGSAVERELRSLTPRRPMTHDLMRDMVQGLGATVERVTVTRLDKNVFYGAVTLNVGGRRLHVDSRPSDSIALAVRTGARIFVADDVMMEAGESDAPWDAEGGGGGGGGGEEDAPDTPQYTGEEYI